jgi:Predicted membrane protein/domain
MQYIGVGRRAVAIIIDSMVIFVIGYVIALFTGGTTAAGFEIEGWPAFLLFFLSLLYYIVLEATIGATLGKLLLGIRVAKPDGSRITWSASITRTILRIIDGLLFYLVGAILVWQSPLKQRLGDRVADTVVVQPSLGVSVDKGDVYPPRG